MASAGDRLTGRYELIEPLGSGGMATVWRAMDLRLGRQVAVKILRPEFTLDDALVRRFEVEARHAASLQHPNVATVFDTGSDGDAHFIVMELADGPTVADLLRQRGSLTAPRAVEVAAAAARALAAAHRRGLVHRDVKPANLLVARDGTVRLADFGIARALTTTRVTLPGTVLGSIPYLSPEQARGEDGTPAGDIFSLGIVLFEMLTGRLPWAADSPAGLATVRLTTPPLQPSLVRAGVPAELDAVVGRALDLDPARRYPSARAFAETLETWLARFASVAPAPASDAAETAAMTAAAGESPRLVADAGARLNPSPAALPADAFAGETAVHAHAAPPAPPPPAQAPRPRHPVRPQAVAPGKRPESHGQRPVPARQPSHGREKAAVLAWVLLLAVVLSALAALAPQGDVLDATGTSSTGTANASPASAAPATPPSSPSRTTTPPPATATSSRPPAPTEKAKPKPKPKPTAKPKQGRTAAPTGPAAPAQAVAAFYTAVEDHDWATATALWSPRMRAQYPPDEWLIGRFRSTTRIDIKRLETVAFDPGAGTAAVAVALVEYRTVEPSPRTFSGTWDLVLIDGRWLLDQPHF